MGGTLSDHLRGFGVNPLGLSRDAMYKELDRQSRLALKMSQVENEKFRVALSQTDMGADMGAALPFGKDLRITNKHITDSPFLPGNTSPPQPVPEALRWLRGQVEEICLLGRSVGV